MTKKANSASNPTPKKKPKREHRDVSPQPYTLGELLAYAGMAGMDIVPIWPPDLFAVAGAFLQKTGAYVGLVNGALYAGENKLIIEPEHAKQLGKSWRDWLNEAIRNELRVTDNQSIPDSFKELNAWWNTFIKAADESMSDCAGNIPVVAAACNLCIVSDEASAGIGLSQGNQSDDLFIMASQTFLNEFQQARSFCWKVPHDKIAVFGKQHTPQRGCTIRSLTHHLSLNMASEIHAKWRGPYPPTGRDLDLCNLLLLPWPTAINAKDFCVANSRTKDKMINNLEVNRYFDYAPIPHESEASIATRVEKALEAAKPHAEDIHGIVLPELSLTLKQFRSLEEVAIKNKLMLIAGVRLEPSEAEQEMPANACIVQPYGLIASGMQEVNGKQAETRLIQHKHHRWCLDRDQIMQYDLGGRLPTSRDCWERIHIAQREINFVTISSWLTICALICEDLARQDPMADIIRTVGPNLVFALLMDGPQLKSRWAARYASVLAEDPGCSVLSLTSLGMSKRSHPRAGGENRYRTIALWRDAVYGEREITLNPDDDACVLSLVCKSRQELSIDGRTDGEQAHTPVFAGAFSFKSHGV